MNSFIIIAILIFGFCRCNNYRNTDRPLSGKWKSLASTVGKLDFSINFKENNTFQVIVTGGAQIETVDGVYKQINDTLLLKDNSHKPIMICNYADTGKYQFKKRDDTLFFQVIEDMCEKRKLTLEIGLLKAKN